MAAELEHVAAGLRDDSTQRIALLRVARALDQEAFLCQLLGRLDQKSDRTAIRAESRKIARTDHAPRDQRLAGLIPRVDGGRPQEWRRLGHFEQRRRVRRFSAGAPTAL